MDNNRLHLTNSIISASSVKTITVGAACTQGTARFLHVIVNKHLPRGVKAYIVIKVSHSRYIYEVSIRNGDRQNIKINIDTLFMGLSTTPSTIEVQFLLNTYSTTYQFVVLNYSSLSIICEEYSSLPDGSKGVKTPPIGPL